MPPTVNLTFGGNSPVKTSSFSGGLFINNKFVDGAEGKLLTVLNPATGKEIAKVCEATAKDVDIAVAAARKAYNEVWGLKTSGSDRGKLLCRFADLIEEHIDELSAIESQDNGKRFSASRGYDLVQTAGVFRYYGGWADKNQGKVIEVDESRLAYTRHEPIGVCGQIIPWNFPAMMFSWKVAPALATGNTVVIKTSELTPLSALRLAELSVEAGFPPGVLNVISGYGLDAGAAISAHMDIDKVAFTGSTLVGRQIMKVAAQTNLKKVTLELGGKSPNIILDDADLEVSARWAAFGIYNNSGQICCAGSRLYIQNSIYDKFIEKFSEVCKNIQVGDAFNNATFQGPQISQVQYNRIMSYIESGKKDGGATLLRGGTGNDKDGYFIEPTVFTDVKHDSKIAREEIFGPVVVVQKFENIDELIKIANDTVYGLAAGVFSTNISRALDVAHRLHAGTVWVNTYNAIDFQVPFGGYKQSGFGRELGEYALQNYTNVKAVHVNLSGPPPL